MGSLGLVPSVNAGDNFVMGEPYVYKAGSRYRLGIDIFINLGFTDLPQTSPERE